MKKVLKAITAGIFLSFLISLVPFQAQCKQISDDVFRLHILANSDSKEDQNLKLKVRDAVLQQTDNIYKNADSKQDAISLTKQSLEKIRQTAQQTVYDNGYDYQVKAEITNMHFNTRHYESVTMPSGDYDALRITIGSAKGKNWWCVMYPALCIGAAANLDELKVNTTQEEYNILDSNGRYEYKFLILEYIQKIGDFFAFNK